MMQQEGLSIEKKSSGNSKQDRFAICFKNLWNRFFILEGGYIVQIQNFTEDKYTGLVVAPNT